MPLAAANRRYLKRTVFRALPQRPLHLPHLPVPEISLPPYLPLYAHLLGVHQAGDQQRGRFLRHPLRRMAHPPVQSLLQGRHRSRTGAILQGPLAAVDLSFPRRTSGRNNYASSYPSPSPFWRKGFISTSTGSGSSSATHHRRAWEARRPRRRRLYAHLKAHHDALRYLPARQDAQTGAHHAQHEGRSR